MRGPAPTRTPLSVLVADDDAAVRTLLGVLVRERLDLPFVHEASDGVEAVTAGLHLRPQIALLDVSMPRLDGVDAALALRRLRPQTALGLCSADPTLHRPCAREHRLPLFDKLETGRIVDWVEQQARAWLDVRGTRTIECTSCGYGIARRVPPARCPMCQSESAWSERPRAVYA